MEFLKKHKKKIIIIFWQYNEHRQVISKLFVLLYHYIFGAVNIKVLVLFGNLCFLALFFFLFKSFKYGVNRSNRMGRSGTLDKMLLFIPVLYYMLISPEEVVAQKAS